MISVLFLSPFALIIVTAGILFSILAYNRKNDTFFWFGVGFTAFATVGIIFTAQYHFYGLTAYQNPFSFMMIGAWIISIIFLVMSKVNQKPKDDHVTDAFLDDVINSEDEIWDPES
ncbi:MAG: hypothetical protein GQ574_27045 [Crocinitomix sp.]|nr:hypothetical protein [Crocinitomix sp.]